MQFLYLLRGGVWLIYTHSLERVGTEPGPAGTELGPAGECDGVMEELAGLGAVRASGVWLKSSLQMGELAL